MKLGFVSAIVPEYTLEQVLNFAHKSGFSSVELMCWPPGKADRRYAGVTHVDVTDLSMDAIEKIQDLLAMHQVSISGLGYYPNPLSADRTESEVAVNHLPKVIDAAAASGGVVRTEVSAPRLGEPCESVWRGTESSNRSAVTGMSRGLALRPLRTVSRKAALGCHDGGTITVTPRRTPGSSNWIMANSARNRWAASTWSPRLVKYWVRLGSARKTGVFGPFREATKSGRASVT